jgi:hypothetical protein
MGGGVFELFDLVMASAYDMAVMNENGANRNLVLLVGGIGLTQCFGHPTLILRHR